MPWFVSMMTNDLKINSRYVVNATTLKPWMRDDIRNQYQSKKALWSARLVSSWSLIEDGNLCKANQIRLLSKGHAMRCCAAAMWHLYKYRNPAAADYATTAKIWPLFAPLVELSRTVIIHGDKPEPSPKKVLPPLRILQHRLLCPPIVPTKWRIKSHDVLRRRSSMFKNLVWKSTKMSHFQ